MGKKDPAIPFKLSLFLLLLLSGCINLEPSYKRSNITKAIKDLCQKEYNLKVKVWEAESKNFPRSYLPKKRIKELIKKGLIGEDEKNKEYLFWRVSSEKELRKRLPSKAKDVLALWRKTHNTIWIYAPFPNFFLNSKGEYAEEISEKISDILFSISRVILSIDEPPRFYVFVASDTKEVGADLYFIGFIPDIVKYQLEFISRGDFQQRRIIESRLVPEALNDTKGEHIKPTNLDMGTFIAMLIRQKLSYIFTEDYKDYFEVEEILSMYFPETKELLVRFQITNTKYELDLPSPFEEALRVSQLFICKIYDFKDLSFLTVEDLLSGKIKTLNRKALEEMVFSEKKKIRLKF